MLKSKFYFKINCSRNMLPFVDMEGVFVRIVRGVCEEGSENECANDEKDLLPNGGHCFFGNLKVFNVLQ